MLDDKPVLYEAPEVPDDWDYDKSVDVMATRMRTWKSLTVEILTELHVARGDLSEPGSHESGWGDYCEAMDSHNARQTVGCNAPLWAMQKTQKRPSLAPVPGRT